VLKNPNRCSLQQNQFEKTGSKFKEAVLKAIWKAFGTASSVL